jgi:hypothetical protein
LTVVRQRTQKKPCAVSKLHVHGAPSRRLLRHSYRTWGRTSSLGLPKGATGLRVQLRRRWHADRGDRRWRANSTGST